MIGRIWTFTIRDGYRVGGISYGIKYLGEILRERKHGPSSYLKFVEIVPQPPKSPPMELQ